ncbi:MAG: phosphatidylserine decarboxylase, partial [Proteobacteria bacterium]
LVGDEELAGRFDKGFYFNLYLAPHNYHHVHFPTAGKLLGATYIPGSLWPVNDYSLSYIPNLFCRNERVITYYESPHGSVLVVMVGAANVGKITVEYDNFHSNRLQDRELQRIAYAGRDMNFQAGDRLGTFHLGSTVVLITEGQPKVELGPPCKVLFGQPLAAW